jgi:hypothetical protein
MKCQECNEPATCHVTEIVAGKAVEYHVCEKHACELDSLQGKEAKQHPLGPMSGPFEVLLDPVAREKLAAYLLPPLCLALLDENPAVRSLAAVWLSQIHEEAASAAGALRAALEDPDERVRSAARFALDMIERK